MQNVGMREVRQRTQTATGTKANTGMEGVGTGMQDVGIMVVHLGMNNLLRLRTLERKRNCVINDAGKRMKTPPSTNANGSRKSVT